MFNYIRGVAKFVTERTNFAPLFKNLLRISIPVCMAMTSTTDFFYATSTVTILTEPDEIGRMVVERVFIRFDDPLSRMVRRLFLAAVRT